jgi:uncharacterized integral membrane protein
VGEKQEFQPLTTEDRITVVIYRAGIVLSAIIISVMAYVLSAGAPNAGLPVDMLAYGMYAAVGISVLSIHLYVRKLKTWLMMLYFISLGGLLILLAIGKGSLAGAISHEPYSLLLMLPLSGCLGFITAKEAFCFKLSEGYLIAMIMPLYLLLVSGSILKGAGAAYGLVLIAAMLVAFTLRKVFMPIAWDIGDKSAYQ